MICARVELQIREPLKQPSRRDALEKLHLSRQFLRACGHQQVNMIHHGSTSSEVNSFVYGYAPEKLFRLNVNVASEKPLSSPG